MAGGTYMLGEERLDTVGTEPAPVHIGGGCPKRCGAPGNWQGVGGESPLQ